MKKGFKCPACGNSCADKLAVIIPDSQSILMLFAQQKTLNRTDVEILCSYCNKRERVDVFRIKRGEPTNVKKGVKRLFGSSMSA
jgi:5-methylcytosine-specific restriction endonuclease McrA